MANEDNPYMDFIGIMRREGAANNPVPYMIGTVVSVSPLMVQVGEVKISRKDMKINTFLLTGYKRRLNLATTGATGQTQETGGGGGYEAFSSHSHAQQTIGVPDGTFTTLDDFFIGDEVLLLVSNDQQQFILLCKLL